MCGKIFVILRMFLNVHDMTRYTTLLFSLLFASSIGVQALDVEVIAPGSLASSVDDPASVTSLAVAGPVDASDFHFMASEMPHLTALDLSAARVEAYEGDPIEGVRIFAANTFPELIMAGTALETVTFPPTLISIGECALAGTHLRSVHIPASVRTVGAGAFAGCRELAEASAATAVLGEGAFAGCTALRSATISGAVPAQCFSGDTSLATVAGAADVTSIGSRAFEGCTSLKDFEFGSALMAVGPRAFSGSAIEEADMDACHSLKTVGAAAFERCPQLRSLLLPESAEVDDAHALAMGCPMLVAVSVPGGVVPAYAFAGDAAVDVSAAIGNAVEVGEYAFKGAASTSEMSLPSSLEYIGDHAMEGMTGLQKIDAEELAEVPALGEEVWSGVDHSAVKLYTTAAMASAFMNTDQWKEFDIRHSSTTGTVMQEVDGTVRACFEGFVLLVDCGGVDVESVTVADIDGRLLARLRPDADGHMILDTSAWSTRVYLLGAIAADGTRFTIKLARNN